MLEEVNMTQMFARRSSSGRQPRPSAWLAEAVGLDELEKTAKQLEGLSCLLHVFLFVGYAHYFAMFFESLLEGEGY